MSDTQNQSVIQSSDDPGELAAAAVRLARSSDPADHVFIEGMLQTPAFLEKLDSEADYAQPRQFLRVASVLTTLKDNPVPSARQVLIHLMQSPVFIEAPSRVELLIDASTTMRPAPPEVAAFWDRHRGADDVYANLLVTTLGNNGSKAAMDLYQTIIEDPAYGDKKRLFWLRSVIPPHRNQPAMLDSCVNLLNGSLTDTLKTGLVEALFHFQKEWFRPSTPIVCAPLSAFDEDARTRLRSVGQFALSYVKMDKTLNAAVKDTLRQLDNPTSME